MSSFRKEFNEYTLEELKDNDNDFGFTLKELFISKDEVMSMLDSIENGVNIIKEGLEKIQGLSEIDEIYTMAKLLSDKLY